VFVPLKLPDAVEPAPGKAVTVPSLFTINPFEIVPARAFVLA
jgi:hypothetical protein